MDSATTQVRDYAPHRTPKIEIRDLCVAYKNQNKRTTDLVLKDVTIDIYNCEFVCIVGPSGCGKSTLISTIAGFIKPASGQLYLDGRSISGPGADRGVVFQEYALLPWKTVIDNVGLGLKFKGVPKAERNHIAQKYLELTKLGHAANQYPHELSGGMKQRAAVARTLANSPSVMLMDEPFAAIDAQTRLTLQEELLRICHATGITVGFVTHSVEEALFLGDRIIVLSRNPGQVKAILDVPISREERQWSSIEDTAAFRLLRTQIMELVRDDESAIAICKG